MTRNVRGPFRGPATLAIRLIVALAMGPTPLWWAWYREAPALWDDPPYVAGG